MKDKLVSCGDIGAISELLVVTDLMKKGYEIYRALSPASYCDLIGLKDNKVYKFEVRTGQYYKKKSGELKIYYPTKRIDNKILVVFTYLDNKIHYIDFEP